MSNDLKKSVGITVTLSGRDLEKFYEIQKKFYVESDAEVLRMGMRFMYENFELVKQLEESGISVNKSVEDFRKELEDLKDRFEKLSKE